MLLGLLERIQNSVLDEFRNRNPDLEKALGGTIEGDLLKIDVLPDDGAAFSIKIPIKTYEDVKEFLITIVAQLPPGRGDLNKFSNYVDSIFQPKSQHEEKPTLIVPKELDSLLPEKVSDVNVQIIPKQNNTDTHTDSNIDDETVGMHLFSG